MADDSASFDTLSSTAQGKLKSLVERIERLEEDKAAVAGDLKEVYAEAKGEGFDTKIIFSSALLLAGSVAYSLLPVASLPDVDFPVIGVGAGLPGGSPETMASAVATPLERQFGRIAGVNQMTSTSSLGSASVTLQFDLNRNIDAASRDVQAAINAARSQLPSYLPQNPSYRKANPADAPILILTLTSDVVPKPQIYDMADSILAQKIAQIQGVGQVFVGGSAQPAVRVELNPMQLANNGVGLEAVRTALSSANANRPKGSFQRWPTSLADQRQRSDIQGRRLCAHHRRL